MNLMMPVFFRNPFSVNLVVTVPILNFFVSIIVMELKYKIKTIKGSASLEGKISGRIENILVSLICVWLGGWKSGGIKNFFV